MACNRAASQLTADDLDLAAETDPLAAEWRRLARRAHWLHGQLAYMELYSTDFKIAALAQENQRYCQVSLAVARAFDAPRNVVLVPAATLGTARDTRSRGSVPIITTTEMISSDARSAAGLQLAVAA